MSFSGRIAGDKGDSKSVAPDVKSSVSSTQIIFLTLEGSVLPRQVVSIINEYHCPLLTEIEKYKNQPDVVADICLAHLNDTKSNGVAFALDALTLEEQQTLFDAWREKDSMPHYLLCAYYSSRNLWDSKLTKYVMNNVLNQVNPNPPGCPHALMHGLKAKFELYKFNTYQRNRLDPNELFRMSTLHLNLKGAYFGDIQTLSGFSFQDVHLGSIDFFDGATFEISLQNVNMAESQLIGANFLKATLDDKAKKDITDYFDKNKKVVEGCKGGYKKLRDSVGNVYDRLMMLYILNMTGEMLVTTQQYGALSTKFSEAFENYKANVQYSAHIPDPGCTIS